MGCSSYMFRDSKLFAAHQCALGVNLPISFFAFRQLICSLSPEAISNESDAGCPRLGVPATQKLSAAKEITHSPRNRFALSHQTGEVGDSVLDDGQLCISRSSATGWRASSCSLLLGSLLEDDSVNDLPDLQHNGLYPILYPTRV
jgi:hypothetical protein